MVAKRGRCSNDVVRAFGGDFGLHVLDRTVEVGVLLGLDEAVVAGDGGLEGGGVDAGLGGDFFNRGALHEERSGLAVLGEVLVGILMGDARFRQALVEAFPGLLVHEDVALAVGVLEHRIEDVAVRGLFVHEALAVDVDENAGLVEGAETLA